MLDVLLWGPNMGRSMHCLGMTVKSRSRVNPGEPHGHGQWYIDAVVL